MFPTGHPRTTIRQQPLRGRNFHRTESNQGLQRGGTYSLESSTTHISFQNETLLNLCRPAPSKFKIVQGMLVRISHLGRRLIFLNLLIGTNPFDVFPTTKRYSCLS